MKSGVIVSGDDRGAVQISVQICSRLHQGQGESRQGSVIQAKLKLGECYVQPHNGLLSFVTKVLRLKMYTHQNVLT